MRECPKCKQKFIVEMEGCSECEEKSAFEHLKDLLQLENLTRWEIRFTDGLAKQTSLSQKERKKIFEIYEARA